MANFLRSTPAVSVSGSTKIIRVMVAVSVLVLSGLALCEDAGVPVLSPDDLHNGTNPLKGVLTLRFVDADGKEVKEANIHAEMIEPEKIRGKSRRPAQPLDTWLKSDGFLFADGGKWAVKIQPSPERPYDGEFETIVEPGKSVALTVQARSVKYVPVLVLVVTGNADPLGKIHLSAVIPRCPRQHPLAITDRDGMAKFNLPAGYEANINTAELSHSPFQPTGAQITAEDKPDQTVKLVMQKRKVVAWCTARLDDDGDVYDFAEHEPSLPVFGPSSIGFAPAGTPPKVPRSAFFKDGRFEFTDLAPGKYAIMDLRFGRVDQETIFIVRPKEPWTFEIPEKLNAAVQLPTIEFPRWSATPTQIRGRLVGCGSVDFANAMVFAARVARNGQPAGKRLSEVIKDNGEFLFGNVPGGIYNLAIEKDDKILGRLDGVVADYRKGVGVLNLACHGGGDAKPEPKTEETGKSKAQ